MVALKKHCPGLKVPVSAFASKSQKQKVMEELFCNTQKLGIDPGRQFYKASLERMHQE